MSTESIITRKLKKTEIIIINVAETTDGIAECPYDVSETRLQRTRILIRKKENR